MIEELKSAPEEEGSEKKNKKDNTSKGLAVMNSKTVEEAKEYKKEVVEAVKTMMGRGYTYGQKVTELTTMFNVGIRQAKKYIKETRLDIKKRKDERNETDYDELLIKYDVLYRELFKQNKLEAASKVLDQYAKLRGLEAPTKNLMLVKHELTRPDYSHLSEAELLTFQTLLNKPNPINL